MEITSVSSNKVKAEKVRNKAGRPTEADLGKRKKRVMEVATELFLQHGFAGTSLVEIAKEAGVATRTLYEHFGNKDAIFREVMYSQNIDSRLVPPVVSTGDTLHDVLIRIAHYSCDVAYSEKSVGLVRLLVAESARFPDLMKKLANIASVRFRNNIAGIFRDLEQAGLIPAGDHNESTRFFIDLVLGNSPLFIYSGWEISAASDEVIQKKVALFILGRFGPDYAANAKRNRAQIRNK